MALRAEDTGVESWLDLLEDEYVINKVKINVVHSKKTFGKFHTDLMERFNRDPLFSLAIDTETEDLDAVNESPVNKGRIICWSAYFGTIRYFFTLEALLYPDMQEILSNRDMNVVYHNAKFDMHMMLNHGVDASKSFLADTIGLHACIDENLRHGLKELSKNDLSLKMSEYTDLFGARKLSVAATKKFVRREMSPEVSQYVRYYHNQYCMMKYTTPGMIINDYCIKTGSFIPKNSLVLKNQIMLRAMVYYGSEDAVATWMLFQKYRKQLQDTPWTKTRTMWDWWMTQERGTVLALWRMERRGVFFNQTEVAESKVKVQEALGNIKGNVINGLPEKHKADVDIGGDNWKKWYLYDHNSIPIIRTTKSWFCTECQKAVTARTDNVCKKHGTQYLVHPPALDSQTLTDLGHRGFGDITLPLVKYAGYSTLLSSFYSKLPRFENQITGRVHSMFNPWLVTFRFSSSKPNLQNIPNGDKDEFGLRSTVQAESGNTLIVADYDQVELRILAQLSQCKDMLELFANKIDIHSATALSAFNLDCLVEEIKELHPSERHRAKSINFGIPYGMGAPALAYKIYVETGIKTTRDDATMFIEAWLDQFPGVRRWLEDRENEVNETGGVRTLLGHRRNLEGIFTAKNNFERGVYERRAKNSPIQSSAAEVIKAAMRKSDRNKDLEKLGCGLILQVHDELVFEVLEENAEEAKDIITTTMSNPFAASLDVELPVSAAIGYNWAEAKAG